LESKLDVYLSPSLNASSADLEKNKIGFKFLHGRLCNKYRLHILMAIYAAVTYRVFGAFALNTRC
jgi:hypothetical protein